MAENSRALLIRGRERASPDTLMVKVGNFLAQDKIFQQRRATAAGAKRILIVGDAHTLIGGQRIIFAAFTKGVEGGELIIRGLGRF